MRRVTIAAAVLAAAVGLSACGSSGAHSQAAATPLSAALSYFPADTPVIATVPTAPNAASTAALSQEPSATVVKAGIFQELAKLGIDYNSDVKPLFGNPIAFGIGSSTVGAGATTVLVAWQTKSAAALSRLAGSVHGLTKAGTHDGATLYTRPGLAAAVDGTLLLVSRDSTALDAALDRHNQGNGFSTSDYAHDTTGLPAGDGVTVVGDLATALSSPRAAQARLVPWVAALGDYGMSVTGSRPLTTLHFRLDTTGRSLTATQLPIATGASPSPVASTGLPVSAGLRDPAQVWAFVNGALRTAAPARYRKLLAKENAGRRDGVDVNALLSSLTGDLQLSSNGHLTYGRERVSPATARTIEQLLAHPPAGAHRTVSLGGGLYQVSESSRPAIVGVVDGTFVASNASVALTRDYASIGSSTVPGAQGALVLHMALGSLLSMSSRLSANPIASQFASMLGDLTMSVQSSTQALTGTVSVGLR